MGPAPGEEFEDLGNPQDMSFEECVYEFVVGNDLKILSLGKDKGKSSEQ